MDAFVEIINPDGTQERFPIEGNQATLGKSGSAQISCPTAQELELEHLLLVPRGNEGCWVSTTQDALTPTLLKGKPFDSGMVRWGSELRIGELRIRITDEREGSESKKVSPVVLIATIAMVGFALITFLNKSSSALPSGAGIEPPALFDETVPSCPDGDDEENAHSAEYRAHSRGDRFRYDLRDGVAAIGLYHEAEVCYLQAEENGKARSMRAHREKLKGDIDAEYAARRLRLHHALQTENWENALVESRALLSITDHINQEHEYVVWLGRTERIVKAKWERQEEEEED